MASRGWRLDPQTISPCLTPLPRGPAPQPPHPPTLHRRRLAFSSNANGLVTPTLGMGFRPCRKLSLCCCSSLPSLLQVLDLPSGIQPPSRVSGASGHPPGPFHQEHSRSISCCGTWDALGPRWWWRKPLPPAHDPLGKVQVAAGVGSRGVAPHGGGRWGADPLVSAQSNNQELALGCQLHQRKEGHHLDEVHAQLNAVGRDQASLQELELPESASSKGSVKSPRPFTHCPTPFSCPLRSQR